MGAPGWFLAFAALSLAFSLSAWLPAKRLGPFSFLYMMSGWLTGELALQHLAWQAVAALAFATAGAVDGVPGVAGLAALFASFGLLVASHLRGLRAAHEVRGALEPLALAPASDVAPTHGFAAPSGCSGPASSGSATSSLEPIRGLIEQTHGQQHQSKEVRERHGTSRMLSGCNYHQNQHGCPEDDHDISELLV